MRCVSDNVIKNGKQTGRQRYKCLDCGKQFQSKARSQKVRDSIWQKFVWGRQTIKRLCAEYGKGKDWVRKQLENATVDFKSVAPCETVIVADTTWFKQAFKVCVIRSPHLKRNLFWLETDRETAEIYKQAREAVEALGFVIKGVVIDGKRGVREVFAGIPVQMCHFHQSKIITRYLTRKPKLVASIELSEIVITLSITTGDDFKEALGAWYIRWSSFLNEKTKNHFTGRWHYTHKKLRAAYRSLINNLPCLFIYQEYSLLNIPNTTNSLEGSFSHLKELVQIHRGLNKAIKRKIIDEILAK